MEKFETFIEKYFWALSFFFMLICSLTAFYFCSLKVSVWYDEAYTMAMVKHSFAGIINITSWDVHPPLYYLLLKVYILIVGDNSILAIRIFSLLGISATFFLALFPVRRLLGKTTAFIFIVLLSLMPVTQYLGTEMRMYSWAMFFVLGGSVYAYDAYKNSTFVAYFTMTLFAVCSAYTHNYAVVAVGFIYILLIASVYRKDRQIRNVIISMVVFFLAYSPWIPSILRQIGRVQEDYWIGALTPRDILLFSYYFFSPKDPEHPYTVFSTPTMAIGLSIMLVLIGIIAFIIIKKQLKKPVDKTLIAGNAFFAVYLLTVIATSIFSLTVKPIIISRYTTCVLGPLLLGISIYITTLIRDRHRTILILSFAMLIILTVARICSERAFAIKQNSILQEVSLFFNQADSPDYIISTPESYPLLAELSAMFPEKKPVVYSPYKYINYMPFDFGVIKFIPDSMRFFRVESLVVVHDSVKIRNQHIVEDKLSYPRFNVYLINTYNQE